ncbi:hypothetical protein [Methylophaga sp.]|uniref:hypothetical protein n=1 Tax=Methylophaga sp. TaxID=2024840 RepID=UPI003A91200F
MRYLVLLFVISLPVHADIVTDNGVVIDTEFAALQKEIRVKESVQCKQSNVAKQISCKVNVGKQFTDSGLVRGTQPYIDKRFMGATDEEINAAISEREDLIKQARDGFYLDKEPGELTQKILRDEKSRLVYLRYHAPERHCRISLDEAQAAVGTDKEAECK